MNLDNHSVTETEKISNRKSIQSDLKPQRPNPPADLTELDQWVCWGYELIDGGKQTKIPLQANGKRASTTNSLTWCSFEHAISAWEKSPKRFAGVGFVFSEADPYCGIDLDDCLDENGEFKPWAQPIIERLADTYAEVSPSGKGVKIWGKAKLSGSGKHAVVGDGAIEVYDRGRYFTVTGNAVTGSPLQIEDHQSTVDWLCSTYAGNRQRAQHVGTDGKIPHGVQHTTLVSMAGSMRRCGMAKDAIFAALCVVNTTQLQKPGTEADMRKIAEGADKWPAGEIPKEPQSAERPVTGPRVVSATDLYAGNIVEARALIEGFLWDGLTMLVAKPKAGKSWLTLQIAVHVAGGRQVQGIDCAEIGPVLYAALEEPESRTMSRLRKIAPAGPWTSNLHFVYDLLPLMGGGFEQLSMLAEKLRPQLIVIDTLTALIKSSSKRESDVFRSQYAEVSQVRKLAEQSKTAVILVHHSRKGVSEDAIEAVAGTGGVAAAVDTVWQLKRRPEGEAVLSTVGRESEDQALAMRFEQEPFGWSIHGDDAGQMLNAERRQILELLCDDGGLTPAQLAAETGKSRAGVRQLLKRMKDDSQVQKQGQKYIPTLSMSHRVTEREKREE